jgi:hypothetical protein
MRRLAPQATETSSKQFDWNGRMKTIRTEG